MKSARRTEHRADGPLIKSDQECGNPAHRSFTFSLAESRLRPRNRPAPSARIMRRSRAEGMTFARHPLPERLQARPQLGGCGIPRPVPGADDDIDGRQLVLMQPERFANDPADAVALHAAARGANRNGETKTRPALVIPEQNHAEKSIAKSPSARVERFEVRLAAQAPLRGKGKPWPGRAVAGQVSPLCRKRWPVPRSCLRDEFSAALGATTRQHPSAALRSHASAEPMCALTPHFARLIGALHTVGSVDGPWVPKRAARLSR